MTLSCLRFRRKISAYLDAALPEPRARAVAAHLTACAGCQGEARKHQRMKTLVRAAVPLPDQPDWDSFWPGIRARILNQAPSSSPVHRLGRHWWPAGWAPRLVLAGASALLVALGLWQGFPGREVPLPGIVIRAVEAHPPGSSVMIFSAPEQEMTVIWVFGLDSQPDNSSGHHLPRMTGS